jgi:hypothetical protein
MAEQNSNEIVEIPANKVIDSLVNSAVYYARDSYQPTRFNLEGELVSHTPQTLPKEFHISAKSIATDSELPVFEAWCDACIEKGNLGQFARDVYDELEEHEFTTRAVAYDEDYRENTTPENIYEKEVNVQIVK